MSLTGRDFLHVVPETADFLAGRGLREFADFMDFPGGDRVCHKRGRSVFRLVLGDRTFYLKRNRLHGVELWKRLCRGKLPPRGARQEWENILAVREAGVPSVTPVAFGERTVSGVETASFTLTEELYGAEPLDAVVRRELHEPLSSKKRRWKRALLDKLADLAERFHGQGMNHQDFYLNHFFLGSEGTFYLLDLQRVQRRSAVPRRSRVKDLGQLNYSVRVYGGFSRTDRMRFFLRYLRKPTLDAEGKKLAREILAKTARIARHDVKLLARRRRRGELP